MANNPPSRAGTSTRQMARKRQRLVLLLLLPVLVVTVAFLFILRSPKAQAAIRGTGILYQPQLLLE